MTPKQVKQFVQDTIREMRAQYDEAFIVKTIAFSLDIRTPIAQQMYDLEKGVQ